MIAAEYKTASAIVRVHDDCFGDSADACLSRISSVVSASCRRRAAEQRTAAAVSQHSEKNMA